MYYYSDILDPRLH